MTLITSKGTRELQIDKLNLSSGTANCLRHARIMSLKDLNDTPIDVLADLKISRDVLREIRPYMQEASLDLDKLDILLEDDETIEKMIVLSHVNHLLDGSVQILVDSFDRTYRTLELMDGCTKLYIALDDCDGVIGSILKDTVSWINQKLFDIGYVVAVNDVELNGIERDMRALVNHYDEYLRNYFAKRRVVDSNTAEQELRREWARLLDGRVLDKVRLIGLERRDDILKFYCEQFGISYMRYGRFFKRYLHDKLSVPQNWPGEKPAVGEWQKKVDSCLVEMRDEQRTLEERIKGYGFVLWGKRVRQKKEDRTYLEKLKAELMEIEQLRNGRIGLENPSNRIREEIFGKLANNNLYTVYDEIEKRYHIVNCHAGELGVFPATFTRCAGENKDFDGYFVRSASSHQSKDTWEVELEEIFYKRATERQAFMSD